MVRKIMKCIKEKFKKLRHHIFLMDALKDEVAELLHYDDWEMLRESNNSDSNRIAKGIINMRINQIRTDQKFISQPDMKRMISLFEKTSANEANWLLFKRAYRYGFDDSKESLKL